MESDNLTPATLSVCVFCGARPGSTAAVALARETGRLIGAAGHRLVWGGGGSGLMGEVAWSAYRSGASLLGIVPRFISERECAIAAPPYEAVLTHTMAERKTLMIDESDAFIALPGGYGTMDEVFEVVSLSYLGVCDKQLVLLGDDSFWHCFAELDASLRGRGYVDADSGPRFLTANTAGEALDLIASLTVREPAPPLAVGA